MGQEKPSEWVIYLRKSKGRVGIPRQRTITTAHLARQGGAVVGEFKDTDRTAFQRAGGVRPPREDFDRMIAFLRAHPGVGIGAVDADRLTRGEDDTRTLRRVCVDGGHLIETSRGGTYDLTTATGRKRFRDDASDAEYEVDHMVERITAAKMEAVAAGEDLGGRRRFGWHKKADGFGIILAEAQCLATGTRQIITGASLHAVTRAWNTAGVTTTTGRPWTPVEVRRVLLRARNAGLLEHHGQVAGKGSGWEAIVTEEEWYACRAILTSSSRRDTPGPARRWLLSGLARCGYPVEEDICGIPVIVTMSGGKGRVSRPVYRDRPRDGTPGHVARDVTAVDAYVVGRVIARLEKHGQEALQPAPADTSLLLGRLRALEDDLAELDQAAKGRSVTLAQAAKWAGPVNREIGEIKAKLAAAAVTSAHARVFTESDIRAGWERAPLDARRAVIAALATVTILPAPRGRPVGHQRGTPYFRPEYVRVEWRRGSGDPPSSLANDTTDR